MDPVQGERLAFKLVSWILANDRATISWQPVKAFSKLPNFSFETHHKIVVGVLHVLVRYLPRNSNQQQEPMAVVVPSSALLHLE